MAMFVQSVTAAEVLAGLTTDSTKWAGANIANLTDLDEPISDLEKFKFIWNTRQSTENFIALAGTWLRTDSATQHTGTFLDNSTETQNDEVAIGTFYNNTSQALSIAVIGTTNNKSGQMDVMLNGASTSVVMEWYSAGSVNNVLQTASLGTVTAGLKTVSLKLPTKNGSSSAYNLIVQAVVIYET